MTNDDEREAREWAKDVLEDGMQYPARTTRAARTILRRLDRPVLPRPEDVPDDVLDAMFEAWRIGRPTPRREDFRASYRALYDHYTQPPSKTAWGVSCGSDWALFSNKRAAQKYANDFPGSRVVKLVEAADDQ